MLPFASPRAPVSAARRLAALLLVAFAAPLALSGAHSSAYSGAYSDAQASDPPVLAAAADAAPRAPSPLTDRIERLLRPTRTGPVFWGVAVQDLETGRLVYARNADTPFLPASNQKLLTVATALDALGSTYRYQTALTFDGRITGSVMRGDFVLRGAGDPSFGSTELDVVDPLRRWAERLAEMGVTRVEGRLIGDDTRFDGQPYPEGWDVDYVTQQASRYLGVSTSALAYRDNVVSLRVRTTRPGRLVDVTVLPPGSIDVTNRLMTSRRRRGSALAIDRTYGTNDLVLGGSLPRVYRGTRDLPVQNPTTFALTCFASYLRAEGIETDLEVADVHDLDRPPADDVPPLFVHLSPPLADLVAVVNKKSNNFYAEQIFRTYGWSGSARGSARRTKTFLRRAGVDTRALSISDGSGLSRKDMVTPRAMVQLLAHMDRHGEREAFRASLAEGGERGSTLKYRLRRVPVRAKTGSLQYVRTLSGYVDRRDGQRLAFAFFANHYAGPSYRITRTLDDLARLLADAPVS